MNCRNKNPKKKWKYISENQKIYLPSGNRQAQVVKIILNHQQKCEIERHHRERNGVLECDCAICGKMKRIVFGFLGMESIKYILGFLNYRSKVRKI